MRYNFKRVLFQVLSNPPEVRYSASLGHELDEAMKENDVPKGLDVIGLIRFATRRK